MRRHILVASLILTAIACSQDGPTNPTLRRNSGTIALAPGVAAVLLSFTPASAVDSVRIGTPAGGYVSQTVNGRVMAYGFPGLGPTVRFQLYGRNVTGATVVQISDSSGKLLSSSAAAVLFDR